MKTYSRKKQGDTTDVIIHLNELCRLCLTKEDELIPIFNDDDPVPLTLRIMACASLVVSLNIIFHLQNLSYNILFIRFSKEMVYRTWYVTHVVIN